MTILKISVNYHPGLYNKNLLLKISINKKGKIYYKLNNDSYKIYTNPVNINNSSTIYYVIDINGDKSKNINLNYTIDKEFPQIISMKAINLIKTNNKTKTIINKKKIIIEFNEKIKLNKANYSKYIKIIDIGS